MKTPFYLLILFLCILSVCFCAYDKNDPNELYKKRQLERFERLVAFVYVGIPYNTTDNTTEPPTAEPTTEPITGESTTEPPQNGTSLPPQVPLDTRKATFFPLMDDFALLSIPESSSFASFFSEV
jgi:hypothetical protein